MEPSKQQLLDSIHPEMRLTKSLLKRVYGYGVTDPAFPDKAIAALEAAGCNKIRQYYQDWVSQYEAAYRAEIEPVAAWYAAECVKEWEKKEKEGEEKRIIHAEMELLEAKRQLLTQKSKILTSC